jgi:ketosteroid isomerase-like protein
VTEGRYTATVRITGAKIDARIAHIFTVRDGKVASWRGYGDTAAVLAAHMGKAASA